MSTNGNGHNGKFYKIFYWCIKAGLNAKSTGVIINRFGCHYTLDKTNKKVGLGVTREAVRQRQRKALKKIKVYLLKNPDEI